MSMLTWRQVTLDEVSCALVVAALAGITAGRFVSMGVRRLARPRITREGNR